MNLKYSGLIILSIILFLCIVTKEGLSYEDKRQYFYCKYRLDSNSQKCQSVLQNIEEKQQPDLIGIIYTKKEDDDKSYSLYKKINEINNGYEYYIKIKPKYSNDYILKRIYSGNNELYSGQEINIPNHNNNPYIIQLYENNQTNCRACNINPAGKHNLCKNCWNSTGTRYDETLIPWKNIGYIYKLNGSKDKFYNLYEKSLDSARNNYRYYIHDTRQDVQIMLSDKEFIQSGTTLHINGKDGQYQIHRYDMQHPSFSFM